MIQCQEGETIINMEVWKDIPGYEGIYQVSDRGRVKSLRKMKRGEVSNPYITSDG